jgi:ribosome-associated heat shock protein Hsp15
MSEKTGARSGTSAEPPSEVRLDVWLDVACLFKTRSEAQRACRGGKVDVNGQPGKPHRFVCAGDRIEIARPSGTRQVLTVAGLADRSIPRQAARLLYEDHTPAPPREEVALRRAERQFRAAQAAAGPPDKRQRRALRRVRGF